MLGQTSLLLVVLGASVSGAPGASAADSPEGGPPEVPGLVVYAGEHDVAETVQRVQEALGEAGMVTATIDHQANAESVGAELRPTTVVIGGAPVAGTPLLLDQQEVGIDLPQKYLVWQDEEGEVWLAHNSAEYLATQAGIDVGSPALTGLMQGSAGVAAAASGTDVPASEGAAVTRYDDYRIEQQSDGSVEEAVARYQVAFADAGLPPLPVVDHQAGAASIGEDLRATQVTYAGNPQVGTPLIAAEQTMGIDLPTRYLARENSDGTVTVGHVDVAVLAQRHGVSGADQALAAVTMGTAAFTAAAAGGEPQVPTMPEGGVATGGGGTSGSEHEGLYVLGALGVLAGVALAARRPGRV